VVRKFHFGRVVTGMKHQNGMLERRAAADVEPLSPAAIVNEIAKCLSLHGSNASCPLAVHTLISAAQADFCSCRSW